MLEIRLFLFDVFSENYFCLKFRFEFSNWERVLRKNLFLLLSLCFCVFCGEDDLREKGPGDTKNNQQHPFKVWAEPKSLDFGELQVNKAEKSLTFKLLTDSENKVKIEKYWFAKGGKNFPYSIKAPVNEFSKDQPAEFSVTYKPNARGLLEDKILLTVFGSTSGAEVAIKGKGLAPEIKAEPKSLDFSNTAVGTLATRKLLLKNVGDFALTIAKTEFDSKPADPFNGRMIANPNVIQPGKSIEMVIGYKTTIRSSFKNKLKIHSDDPVN